MGFASYGDLVDEIVTSGKTRTYSWRKSPSQLTVQGIWADLSMSPGNPVPNYYASAPLIAQQISSNGGFEGMFHGAAMTPDTKHLKDIMVLANSATGLPVTFILCDYLLYYPFIDQGSTDEQLMDNSITLPRYTDGAGLQVMAVEVASQIGSQQFSINYTNQDGVAGRISQTVTCNTHTSSGTIITSAPATAGCRGPFIPLQSGDTGIRSVESLTMLGADVGLITLVIVRPLATFILRGVDAPVEVDFLKDRPSLPRIYDGAYLNLLALPSASLAATAFHGTLTTIWG